MIPSPYSQPWDATEAIDGDSRTAALVSIQKSPTAWPTGSVSDATKFRPEMLVCHVTAFHVGAPFWSSPILRRLRKFAKY